MDISDAGQVFKLPEDLEEDYFKGLTPAQSRDRQNRIFRTMVLQKGTPEEIFSGIQKAEVRMTDLNEEEKKQVKELIKALAKKQLEQAKAADDLLDLLEE